jgi:hypothetical protein
MVEIPGTLYDGSFFLVSAARIFDPKSVSPKLEPDQRRLHWVLSHPPPNVSKLLAGSTVQVQTAFELSDESMTQGAP